MSKKIIRLACLCLFVSVINTPSVAYSVEGISAITLEQAEKEVARQIVKQAYVDKLIDPNIAEDLPLAEVEKKLIEKRRKEGTGLRAYQIDWNYKYDSEKQSSQGVGFSGFRQTAHYGDFRLALHGNKKTIADETQFNGVMTLQNQRFPLNNDYFADTGFGVINGAQNSMLRNSRYQNLPANTLLGVSSRFYSKDKELRVAHGEVGHVVDEAHFKGDDIRVTGFGYARKFSESLQAASQLWHVENGIASVEFANAIRYQKEEASPEYQFQLVANDNAFGISAESEFNLSRSHNTAGFYFMQDGLSWMGREIADDAVGIFAQSHYQLPWLSISTNADYQISNQSNAEDKKASLSFAQHYNVIKNTTTRYGGGIRVNHSEDLSVSDDYGKKYHALFYFGKDFASGFSNRIQLDVSQTESKAEQEKERTKNIGVTYSALWELPREINLGWDIQAEKAKSNVSGKSNTVSTGLSLTKNIGGTGFLSSSLRYSPDTNEDEKDDKNWNLSFAYDQMLNKNWNVGSYINYGTNPDEEKGEYELGVNLVYNKQSGRPFALQGKGRGGRLGEIRGSIFFDKNGDGMRQPSEKFAKDIRIQLDGITQEITDQFGRFHFPLVQTGKHAISVDIDSVPLPWEIKKITRTVNVELRQTQRITIPLSLISG